MHIWLIYFESKLCKEVIDDLFNPGLLLFKLCLWLHLNVYLNAQSYNFDHYLYSSTSLNSLYILHTLKFKI